MLSFPCMTHAKHALWLSAAVSLVAVATACSMAGSADALAGSGGAAPPENVGDPSGRGGTDSEGTGTMAPGTPTANGLIFVHAATFPSYRLCFENHPNLLPQPDSKVMPAANVVGVEVGSVVRVDPIEAPGKIYVVRERVVRTAPGETTGVPCGELLGNGSQALDRNTDYFEATVAGQPLGVQTALGKNSVHVLAITGCGDSALVTSVGADSSVCGAGWDSSAGNLAANVIDLPTSAQGATESSIPVQLVHLSPAIQQALGPAKLEITFGDLSAPGPLPSAVASDLPLLQTSAPVSLDVDQSDTKVYGTYGFRVRGVQQGGPETFAFDQSLAAVQDLSAPRDVPTSYYRVASNYALLLLGDPAVPAKLDGGANNPDRRRVQLLAIPVLDPATLDAGADASAAPGDGGS